MNRATFALAWAASIVVAVAAVVAVPSWGALEAVLVFAGSLSAASVLAPRARTPPAPAAPCVGCQAIYLRIELEDAPAQERCSTCGCTWRRV